MRLWSLQDNNNGSLNFDLQRTLSDFQIIFMFLNNIFNIFKFI